MSIPSGLVLGFLFSWPAFRSRQLCYLVFIRTAKKRITVLYGESHGFRHCIFVICFNSFWCWMLFHNSLFDMIIVLFLFCFILISIPFIFIIILSGYFFLYSLSFHYLSRIGIRYVKQVSVAYYVMCKFMNSRG